MFLRQNKRRKNGKTHRYFTVVENRRVGGGGTTQRQVLYLGEINDTQQQAWRRTLQVFDEDREQYRELSLFFDDRPLPPGALDSISVKLDQMEFAGRVRWATALRSERGSKTGGGAGRGRGSIYRLSGRCN